MSKKKITEPIYKIYGAISDTHLCSDFCRLDAVKTLYSMFADAGIQTVLHAGNLVEGPPKYDSAVEPITIDGQIQYVIDEYPHVSGIRTMFITGDDHEGWWQKPGFNFGSTLELVAKKEGRSDLCYAGHVESDLRIGSGKNSILRIQHPGGGSAYARSYKIQKQIESFEGGEKPAVLIQGHYHEANFCTHRNVYGINLPGCQSQTVFGRKQGLRYEIGGAIIRLAQGADGSITRCYVEFIMFYDRKYYKKYLKSDEKATELITI